MLVVLGSTTLWELRCNITAGGDEVPKEVDGTEDMEEVDHEDDEEGEGNEGEDVEERKRKRKRRRRGMLRWKEEKRTTGSLIEIERVLYPDAQEDVENYAE